MADWHYFVCECEDFEGCKARFDDETFKAGQAVAEKLEGDDARQDKLVVSPECAKKYGTVYQSGDGWVVVEAGTMKEG